MKKVRAVELNENKKLPIIIIAVAALMLIFSVVSIEISGSGISVGLSSLSSVISVLPLTIGVSTFMIIKTKKPAFGEFPCYIISVLVVMAFVLLFVFKVLEGFEFFAIMVCVLMIYPYIIAGLTVRGCMFNKLISIGFSALLLVISLIAVGAVTVLLSGFSFTYLILPLMYVELILNIMCFDLKPIKKKNEEYEKIID